MFSYEIPDRQKMWNCQSLKRHISLWPLWVFSCLIVQGHYEIEWQNIFFGRNITDSSSGFVVSQLWWCGRAEPGKSNLQKSSCCIWDGIFSLFWDLRRNEYHTPSKWKYWNGATLRRQNLPLISWKESILTTGFRSLKWDTVLLCRSKDFVAYQTLRMIPLSRNRTRAMCTWCMVGWEAGFFLISKFDGF